MREYGKVYTAFWADPSMRAMSEDARTLALYLLTCPHGNLIGLFRLPDAYAADDLQWSIERVSKGFRELFERGFCDRDGASNWLVIPNYTRWNQFENPNVAKSASKVFESAPDCSAKSICARGLLKHCANLPEPFRKGLETLLDSVRKPEPSQSLARAEPEPEPEPEPVATAASPPRPPAQRGPSKTDAIWRAYSDEYRAVYGADPVRNAKVNGQLANIVDRIGAEDAPPVAAWFVHHRKRWYVERGHSIETLQRDCEQLRTEWATGRRSTSTAAIQADRTQQTGDVFSKLIAEAEEAQRAS